MQLTLFYAPMTCALVPYVTLLEAGAKFDVEVVNFLKGDHLAPDYLKLNPKHKVPVLLVDGEPLTENPAILQWIAEVYQDRQLVPEGADKFRALSLMSWCASSIHPSLTPNALPGRYCDLPGSEQSVKTCAQKITREQFAIAEDLLSNRDWFFTEFSIPDVFFFWCFRRAKQFGMDLTEFKYCSAHFKRVESRACVQQVLKFETQLLEDWASE